MSLTKLKVGDTVILHMFTGIAVGVKEVLKADKSTVTLETRVGMAKFSRKTGKQIEPKAKQERFTNYITEDDGSYKPGDNGRKAKKKSDKPKTKKPVEDEEDEEDKDEPVAKKKSVKKKPAPRAIPQKIAKKVKGKKKPKPEEDEDDLNDYEEEE